MRSNRTPGQMASIRPILNTTGPSTSGLPTVRGVLRPQNQTIRFITIPQNMPAPPALIPVGIVPPRFEGNPSPPSAQIVHPVIINNKTEAKAQTNRLAVIPFNQMEVPLSQEQQISRLKRDSEQQRVYTKNLEASYKNLQNQHQRLILQTEQQEQLQRKEQQNE